MGSLLAWAAAALYAATFGGAVRAAGISSLDQFGGGSNSFTIEFVEIGDPGNPPDANPNPAGAVPYVYRIGKYEISEQMIDKANALGGLGITKDTRGPDKPATSVSWYEAARFVNWLNTSTNNAPAYKFDAQGVFQLWLPTDAGYDDKNLYRNKRAKYFLPSVNEWHKAAYYDGVADVYYDYPTGSDSAPDGIDFAGDTMFDAVFDEGGSNGGPNDVTSVGLLSPYGIAGQGGNVAEWEETTVDRINDSISDGRGLRGGGWGSGISLLLASNRNGIIATFESGALGLRVARFVPEADALSLLSIVIACCLNITRRAKGITLRESKGAQLNSHH